jgi:hypothetical protein
MFILRRFFTFLFLYFSFVQAKSENHQIKVEYPEVYELANIVLSLTNYAIIDPYEIQKESKYYEEVIKHFKLFKNHPLLDSINFSRQKWQEFLSFRSDSYFFKFTKNGKLKRDIQYYSFEGFNEFDKNLSLIEDFVEKSNYRRFYSDHKEFYSRITNSYSDFFKINEMLVFFQNETGLKKNRYSFNIVLSALVGSQNLHREISRLNSIEFVPVPLILLQNFCFEKFERINQAMEVHTLFTEIAHKYFAGFNKKYRKKITENFNDSIWDKNSGYSEYPGAVFEEYITWAMYDIFLNKHFSEFAFEVGCYWHFQNDSRGFPFSFYFAQELKRLNIEIQHGKKSDLFIPLFKWCKSQSNLSQPFILNNSDTIIILSNDSFILLQFSEPIQNGNTLTYLVENKLSTIDTIYSNTGKWFNETTLLLPIYKISYKSGKIILNWWGTFPPIVSLKGVPLKSNSTIIFSRKSTDN